MPKSISHPRLAGPAQLAELTGIAARFRVAIVCVTDLARVNRGKTAYQVDGNRALTAAARAGWGIVQHPRERDRRVMLPLKRNLGPPAAALEFVIGVQGIRWEAEPAKVTPEALLAAERAGSDLEGAERWLLAYLAQGSRPSKEILAQARECGLSIKTLRRAKDALGITARRTEFEKGKAHWSWSLADGSDREADRPEGETETARLCAAG